MTTIHPAGPEPNLHVDEEGKLTDDKDDLEIEACEMLLDSIYSMCCFVAPEDSFKVVDTWREEKRATGRDAKKVWYKRSDSKKDYTTTDEPHFMQMIFYETSDHKVNPGDDSMNYRQQLARTCTGDEDDEFDKKPKSEDVPLAFIETIDEKEKPQEASVLTMFFEMMDEKLKPLDDPVYSREQLPGTPSSRLEDDDEIAEESNPVVYPVYYWEQLSSLLSVCREDDDKFEKKSKPEEDLVYRTAGEASCPEVTLTHSQRRRGRC